MQNDINKWRRSQGLWKMKETNKMTFETTMLMIALAIAVIFLLSNYQ